MHADTCYMCHLFQGGDNIFEGGKPQLRLCGVLKRQRDCPMRGVHRHILLQYRWEQHLSIAVCKQSRSRISVAVALSQMCLTTQQ